MSEPTVYEMPKVEVGDWVLWTQHGGSEPVPGMVSKVGGRSLILWVISPGYGGNEKFSVHHKGDPGLLEFPEWKQYGTWEVKPSQYAVLSEKLAGLDKRIAELEGRRGR